METTVVLSRKMGDYAVTQRTKDGYFDGNELLRQWNACNDKKKTVEDFLSLSNTKEFVDELSLTDDCRKADNQLFMKSKGKMTINGRTPDKIWMHPYLFIKFSMWINPRFEVAVIKFVYDELIKFRNEAGDAYREMSESVAKLSKKGEIQKNIIKVAEAINFIAQNDHAKMIRNQASEIQMKEYVRIEKEITMLVNKGFVKTFEGLMEYLRSEWRTKYQPALFNGQ